MNNTPSTAKQVRTNNSTQFQKKKESEDQKLYSGKNWRVSRGNSTVTTTITESFKSESSSCEKESQKSLRKGSKLKPQREKGKKIEEGNNKIRTSSYSSGIAKYIREEKKNKTTRSEKKGKKDSCNFLSSRTKDSSPTASELNRDVLSLQQKWRNEKLQQNEEIKNLKDSELGNNFVDNEHGEICREGLKEDDFTRVEKSKNTQPASSSNLSKKEKNESESSYLKILTAQASSIPGGYKREELEVDDKVLTTGNYGENEPKFSRVKLILNELKSKKIESYSIMLENFMEKICKKESLLGNPAVEGNDKKTKILTMMENGNIFTLKKEKKKILVDNFMPLEKKISLDLPFYDLYSQKKLPNIIKIACHQQNSGQDYIDNKKESGIEFYDMFDFYLIDNKLDSDISPEFDYAKIFGVEEDEKEEEEYLKEFIAQELSNPKLEKEQKNIEVFTKNEEIVDLFSKMNPQYPYGNKFSLDQGTLKIPNNSEQIFLSQSQPGFEFGNQFNQENLGLEMSYANNLGMDFELGNKTLEAVNYEPSNSNNNPNCFQQDNLNSQQEFFESRNQEQVYRVDNATFQSYQNFDSSQKDHLVFKETQSPQARKFSNNNAPPIQGGFEMEETDYQFKGNSHQYFDQTEHEHAKNNRNFVQKEDKREPIRERFYPSKNEIKESTSKKEYLVNEDYKTQNIIYQQKIGSFKDEEEYYFDIEEDQEEEKYWLNDDNRKGKMNEREDEDYHHHSAKRFHNRRKFNNFNNNNKKKYYKKGPKNYNNRNWKWEKGYNSNSYRRNQYEKEDDFFENSHSRESNRNYPNERRYNQRKTYHQVNKSNGYKKEYKNKYRRDYNKEDSESQGYNHYHNKTHYKKKFKTGYKKYYQRRGDDSQSEGYRNRNHFNRRTKYEYDQDVEY